VIRQSRRVSVSRRRGSGWRANLTLTTGVGITVSSHLLVFVTVEFKVWKCKGNHVFWQDAVGQEQTCDPDKKKSGRSRSDPNRNCWNLLQISWLSSSGQWLVVLRKEAVSSEETLVNLYRATRCSYSEDRHVRTRRRGKLKSHSLYFFLLIFLYCTVQFRWTWSVLWHTEGRTAWTSDQLVARPAPTRTEDTHPWF
jgi:hypothetical protein